MKKHEAIELLKKSSRENRHDLDTEKSYCGCIARFFDWCSKNKINASNEGRVTAYLSDNAERWSESTQRVELNALVFFFKHVLRKPLGILPEWTRAQRPRRLPEWLTDSEARSVLGFLRDADYLACALMYGSGLRRKEAVSLRIRDINLEHGTLTIRGGKGDKDRVTCLPRALVDDIQRRITNSIAIYEHDKALNRHGIYVPPAVEHKQHGAAKQLHYFWLFPAAGLSRDPRSGVVRRHHLHDDTVAKALRVAVSHAKILRRVTCHSLRHSFATQYLLNGGTIHELKQLLGHASIQTTEVYLHCLPQLGARIQSPLDVQPSKITPFRLPDSTPFLEKGAQL